MLLDGVTAAAGARKGRRREGRSDRSAHGADGHPIVGMERSSDLAFRSIVVAIEDSPDGRAAMAQAIDIAVYFRARLTLVALEHIMPWALGYGANATALSTVMQDIELRASKALAHAIRSAPAEIPITTIRACEPALPLLKRLMDQGEHDLLVVGARSHVRSMFGTHARLHKLLAKSTSVDVLVARYSSALN